MNWFQKVSQELGQLNQKGFQSQMAEIITNVMQGDGQMVWNLDTAIEQIQGLMQTNGDDIVCQELMGMLSQYAQGVTNATATEMKDRCCGGGYQIPLPNQEQQDPMQQDLMQDPMAMPMMGGQDKPMDMPSAEFS